MSKSNSKIPIILRSLIPFLIIGGLALFGSSIFEETADSTGSDEMNLDSSDVVMYIIVFMVISTSFSTIVFVLMRRSQLSGQEKGESTSSDIRYYCSSCGQQLSLADMLCPSCGDPTDEEKKILKK